MLSRENRVQVGAMALALLVLLGFATLLPSDPGAVWFAAFSLVFYSIAFGGANLYLYLVDDGGAVPRSARGRFLATVAIVVPLWAGANIWAGTTLFGVDAGVLLGSVSVLVFAAYFGNEVRLGYADFEAAELR